MYFVHSIFNLLLYSLQNRENLRQINKFMFSRLKMMTKMSKLKENVRKFSIQKNLNFTSSQLLFPLLRHQTLIGEHFSTLNNRKFQSPVLLLLQKKKKESLLRMPLKVILLTDTENMEDHFHNRTLVQQVKAN